MKIGARDTNEKVFVIAEIGNNHEGDYALAEELIHLAAQAGVDAVKFQTIIPERLVSSQDAKRIVQLQRFQLTYEEFEQLSRVARGEGVEFLSTPFDLESVQFLAHVVPAFKIASGDNTFYPLLEAIAKVGKPIILSTGLTTLDEVVYSKNCIDSVWNQTGISQELAVLHCVSSYPVPPEDANLAAITTLRNAISCTVGYSDHTIGNDAAVLSVALGARIIEKHFTIDKHYSDFRDHQLSADPRDMKELVERVRHTFLLLGTGEKIVQKSEYATLKAVRRSIAAQRDLLQGATLSYDDLTWLRPGDGIPPGSEQEVIGKRLRRHVRAGELLTAEMFE